MKHIKLTCNKKAIVDNEDFYYLNNFKWQYHNKNYAVHHIRNRKSILMHRFIMNISDPKVEIDHINHNGLDNRKSNLRICSNRQNHYNSKIRKDNKSGFKGVYFHKVSKKWEVRIKFNGRKLYLGQFKSKLDAAKKYNDAAKIYYGEFALLNSI